jgi:hypothetical protein
MPSIGKSGRICTSENCDYRTLSAPSTPDDGFKAKIAARAGAILDNDWLAKSLG